MARDHDPYQLPDGRGEALGRFEGAISGMGPADLRRMLAQLQAAGRADVDLDERTAPPSHAARTRRTR